MTVNNPARSLLQSPRITTVRWQAAGTKGFLPGLFTVTSTVPQDQSLASINPEAVRSLASAAGAAHRCFLAFIAFPAVSRPLSSASFFRFVYMVPIGTRTVPQANTDSRHLMPVSTSIRFVVEHVDNLVSSTCVPTSMYEFTFRELISSRYSAHSPLQMLMKLTDSYLDYHFLG